MPEEEFSLSEPNQLLPSIITQLVFEENLLRRLNGTYTLLSALDEDLAIKVNATKHKRWIQQLLNDVLFIRQLSLYSKVVDIPETAIELFGTDYLTHPEFQFDDKFQNRIISINKTLSILIGHILREYNTMGDIEL